MNKTRHITVLKKEVINLLGVTKDGTFIDATLGGGGHFREMINRAKKNDLKATLVGIDQDQDAIKRFEARLKEIEHQNIEIKIINSNFENLSKIISENSLKDIKGIYADLGTSHDQLSDNSRGFSYVEHGPLDMRMDKSLQVKASDLINGLGKPELVKLFQGTADLGPLANRLANKIIEERREKPILTTKQLVKVIRQIVPLHESSRMVLKPEARVFQALRIAVNHEFGALRKFLPQAFEALDAKGKIVILSFHSGEDRIVKNFFKELVESGKAKYVTKLMRASELERSRNPRSSSVKLRAIQKVN